MEAFTDMYKEINRNSKKIKVNDDEGIFDITIKVKNENHTVQI